MGGARHWAFDVEARVIPLRIKPAKTRRERQRMAVLRTG
jgi:hypothetical protein